MMKKITQILLYSIAIIGINVIVTLWINHQSKTIYSINLNKIIAAQLFMAGRVTPNATNQKQLLQEVKTEITHVRPIIQKYAGQHVVIVSPAIVQGSLDITNKVLKALGLPTQVPTTPLSEQAVIPSLLQIKTVNTAHIEPNAWMLP